MTSYGKYKRDKVACSYNCQDRVGQTGGQTALPQMEAELENVARQP